MVTRYGPMWPHLSLNGVWLAHGRLGSWVLLLAPSGGPKPSRSGVCTPPAGVEGLGRSSGLPGDAIRGPGLLRPSPRKAQPLGVVFSARQIMPASPSSTAAAPVPRYSPEPPPSMRSCLGCAFACLFLFVNVSLMQNNWSFAHGISYEDPLTSTLHRWQSFDSLG